MKISTTNKLCERGGMSAAWLILLVVAVTGFTANAQSTNNEAGTNAAPVPSANTSVETNAAPPVAPAPEVAPATPPRVASASEGFDEAAFRIVTERNIFNANRSGGTVRISSPTKRQGTIQSFTLVGTMAYEKGAFAFFEGSSSEFTKVLKPDGLIAGHKLMDIYANSVKMDVDGKDIELPIGSQMRREDEGLWHVAEAVGYVSSSGGNGGGDSSSRSSRSGRSGGGDYRSRSGRGSDSNSGSSRNGSSESRSASPAAASPAGPAEDPAEVLKRLMEKRAKEDQ